jgi:alpha-1,6-mannosyltransferase
MRNRLIPILAAGAVLEAIWIGTRLLGPLREHTAAFIALMLAAFALCVWSFLLIPLIDTTATWIMLAFALIFRLTVLSAQPYQSEDVYRYLWDARMGAEGIGPYQFPPNSPRLERLRDTDVYPMINSKPYITAYPPLSQLLFRICYRIFGNRVVPMKAVFMLLEFAGLLLAWNLVARFDRPPKALYLLAWNPFFIFECSYSGHSEGAMIFFVYLSFYLLSRNRKSWAMLSYFGAVLVKLHPALWFPIFLRRTGLRAGLLGLSASALCVMAYFTPTSFLLYLKYLGLYFKLFEFNAGIHYLLRFVGHAAFDASWDKATGPYLGFLVLVFAVLIAWKFPIRTDQDLLHAGFWIMTADLCLATTVHPWYISWAALSLPLFPYAFMLYWTGASFLSYAAYAYHPVFEPRWVLLVEYVPLYCLMGWEIYRGCPLLTAGQAEQALYRRRQTSL